MPCSRTGRLGVPAYMSGAVVRPVGRQSKSIPAPHAKPRTEHDGDGRQHDQQQPAHHLGIGQAASRGGGERLISPPPDGSSTRFTGSPVHRFTVTMPSVTMLNQRNLQAVQRQRQRKAREQGEQQDQHFLERSGEQVQDQFLRSACIHDPPCSTAATMVAKLSSVTTMRAALLATSVPVMLHR